MTDNKFLDKMSKTPFFYGAITNGESIRIANIPKDHLDRLIKLARRGSSK